MGDENEYRKLLESPIKLEKNQLWQMNICDMWTNATNSYILRSVVRIHKTQRTS